MPPRRACDICFKRKIQCSISVPGQPCDWCSHQSVPCTFNRGPKRKSTDLVAALADPRLRRQLEQFTSDLNQKRTQIAISKAGLPDAYDPFLIADEQNESSSTRFRQTAPDSSATGSRVAHAAAQAGSEVEISATQIRLLGRNWYFKGIKLLSKAGIEWIAARTGQQTAIETFSFGQFVTNPILSLPRQQYGHRLDRVDLEFPLKKTTERATQTFFDSRFAKTYPMLDQQILSNAIDAAYELPESTRQTTQISAKACVWALHAIIARLDPAILVLEDGESCANRAHGLLSLVEESNVAALQAILLLQCLDDFTGRWEESSSLHPLACRMVCDLGGHFGPQPGLESQSPEESNRQDYIRRLFWLCYMNDKDISLRSGRPPLLTSDYCDVSLPEWADIAHGATGTESVRDLTQDPHLSIIKDKACRTLHSPSTFKLQDSRLLWNIRELDDDLEKWRLSIPAWMRPQLTVQSTRLNMPAQASELQKLQSINLQLDYLHMLINIHTTVRRCGTNHRDESMAEDLHSVVHSSIDLALEAARSTLRFLMAGTSVLGVYSIRHIFFHAPTAAMALFLNVLIHPFDSRTSSDLELLADASRSFDRPRTQDVTVTEAKRVNALCEFILELSRLGDCGVRVAKTSYP